MNVDANSIADDSFTIDAAVWLL